MKKIILSLVAIIVVGLFSLRSAECGVLELKSAQTDLLGTVDGEELKSHAHIKNNSISTVNVKAEFSVISIAEGHEYQVCTTMSCYPPKSVDWSTPSFPISASYTLNDNDFYMGLITNNIAGTTIIKVKVTNAADDTDFVEYTVTFLITELGVQEYYTQNSTIYPNPVSNSVSIKLDNKTVRNSEFKVFNSNGELVSSQNISIDTDIIQLQVNSLPVGNYFFSLTDANGKLSAGKFSVSR